MPEQLYVNPHLRDKDEPLPWGGLVVDGESGFIVSVVSSQWDSFPKT